MYQWVKIDNVDGYDQLLSLIDGEYGPQWIVTRLKQSISAAVRGILLETDYVDKDYRSTYYNYYAKKGRAYRADCLRLHFFDELVSLDPTSLDLVSADGHPEHHYFGYMILRPTHVATVGRSILSPDVRTGARGAIIQAEHKVHLLGRTLNVWGFPSMDQHSDIAVCAHVACWSVLRHYSERYAQHKEYLLHDVTMMASDFDPGGLVPANGLAIAEAERIFQAANTYPVVITKNHRTPAMFYRQLLAYVESGFPLFVGMQDKQHALVAVGHAWRGGTPIPSGASQHAWDQVESVVVIDDNVLPYLCAPTDPSAKVGLGYSTDDFDRLIVALPEKIYYPAEAVDEYAATLGKQLARFFAMPPAEELVVRYFVTTTAALRRFMRANQSQFGLTLLKAVMELPMSQFIWVVEYCSQAQWQAGTIAVRVVIDATASPRDPMPVWFTHNNQQAILFDRTTYANTPTIIAAGAKAAPLSRMEQNLRPIRVR